MIYSLEELTSLLSPRAADNDHLIGAKVAYPTGDEGEFEICLVSRMGRIDIGIEMPVCCVQCGGACRTLYLWHCVHGWRHLLTREGVYVCDMGEYRCSQHSPITHERVVVWLTQQNDEGDARLHRPPAGSGREMMN